MMAVFVCIIIIALLLMYTNLGSRFLRNLLNGFIAVGMVALFLLKRGHLLF
jgi:hypothetical protein